MTFALLAWSAAVSAGAHATQTEHSVHSSLRALASAPELRGHDVWKAVSGQSLRETVAEWSLRAGYELVWDADYDFPVRAGVRLTGNFIEVMTDLFNAYAAADRPLAVDIFKEQKLVRVYARGE